MSTPPASTLLEPPAQAAPGFTQILRDFGSTQAVNGLIGFIFAATGPVAVILSVGTQGGLSEAQIASWIFGAFCLNSLLTLFLTWRWRTPLVCFWTIPGTVLVGPALGHLSFAEVTGAFLATGVLMVLMGASGLVRRFMQAVPMPIVMGMVAGVFLKFGLNVVFAVRDALWLAGPMTAAYFATAALPALARRVPPLIATLLTGIALILMAGGPTPSGAATQWLAQPIFQMPQWSLPALLELVVPLAITVLVVQNAQGFAVLETAGHRPPVNIVTLACGAASIVTALCGTVSSCLTGPTNAMVCASGPRERHYTGALFVGILGVVFGLLAPAFTKSLLATPPAFIAVLGGLAMLRVLQTAFTTAFRDRVPVGALCCFVVTVADVPIAGIGAPFWALLIGLLVSSLIERTDLRALRQR